MKKILALSLIVLLSNCGKKEDQTTATPPKPFYAYRFIGERVPFAQCQTESYADRCLILSDCTDGRTYLCLVNVERRKVKAGW